MEKLIDAVRVLSVEIGPRGSASEAERQAAEYAAERLRRAGFEVKIEPFRGLTTFSLPYGLIYSGFVLAAPLHLLSPAASFALALLSLAAFLTEIHALPTLSRILPKGQSDSAYGVRVTYQGMEGDITQPKNKLILTLENEHSKQDARPELYYSQRLDGIMKRPYISKSLWSDLYFSPQEIQDEACAGGLLLTKGETKRVGDYTLTFTGFSMDQHDLSQRALQVSALLQVAYGSVTDTVAPALVVVTADDGRSSIKDMPARFGRDKEQEVAIDKVLADEGAVVLSLPGLVESGQPETLILNVSQKPLINLVWVGTTLILLGSLIVFVRRRARLPDKIIALKKSPTWHGFPS